MQTLADYINQQFGVPSPGAVNDKLIQFYSKLFTGSGSPVGSKTGPGFYFDLTNSLLYTNPNADRTSWANIASGLTGSTKTKDTILGQLALANETTPDSGFNTAIGAGALQHITTGQFYTAVGFDAGNAAQTSGNGSCTYIGYAAGSGNTTGSDNTCVGGSAGSGSGSCTYIRNTIIGSGTGQTLSTGSSNVMIGYLAGGFTSTGQQNVFIGERAGAAASGASAQSGCIFIGYFAGNQETTSNKLYIANTSTTTPLIFGDFSASYVTINGGLRSAVSTKITTYTITAADKIILADATTAGFTVTLPAPAAGMEYTVKKIDASANAVTVGVTTGTIDGAATFALGTQFAKVTVVSDGTNWFIIA